MTTPLIQIEQLQKIFHTDEVETHALSNINLNLYEGEYVSISGPSGCGKSTLLSIIGLLDVPTSGRYCLAGTEISTLSKSDRARIRNKQIGFVFQSFNLISELTIGENVELPLTYRKDLSRSDRQAKVSEALAKVDMSHRAQHYPSQLSGGQQQRVAVARAIVGNPSIILADEPTGNLDTKNAESVMALLDKLHCEGATICMVTHDPRSRLRAQRNVSILDGMITADHLIDKTELTEHDVQLQRA